MGGVSIFGADLFGDLNKGEDTKSTSSLEASMKPKKEVQDVL